MVKTRGQQKYYQQTTTCSSCNSTVYSCTGIVGSDFEVLDVAKFERQFGHVEIANTSRKGTLLDVTKLSMCAYVSVCIRNLRSDS